MATGRLIACLVGFGLPLASGVTLAHADGEHLKGRFYLNLRSGVGYGALAHETGDELCLLGDCVDFTFDFEVRGMAVPIGVSVGGTLAENLVFYGDFSFWFMVAEGDAVEINGEGAPDDVTAIAHALGVGPGLAYYFTPANIYVAGTIAITAIGAEVEENHERVFEFNAGRGIGGSVRVGKEWRLSKRWGLGAAAEAFVTSNPSTGDGGRRTSKFFGLLCSATLN